MRVPASKTDRAIYFVAVDSADLKTRESGLTGFTVKYSINGGAMGSFSSVSTTELSSGDMPGVYSLTINEAAATTLTGTNRSEELVLHITHASMAPVTRTVEIYQPTLAEDLESGINVQKALRAMAAVLAGTAAGGPSSSAFKGIGTSTVRVTSSADSKGDRTSVTLNL
tara:strand:- start:9128 stop:9634 length:507 start_codon:yes stop_codon:yes gene_type:complete